MDSMWDAKGCHGNAMCCRQVADFDVFLQAMIYASRSADLHESLNGAQYDEDSAVFFLELLIKVVLQNRLPVSL